MMNIFRVIILIISILLILLDIGPFFRSGEINIGLVSAVAAGVVLLIYFVFFNRINEVIRKIWTFTAGKVMLSAMALLLCVFIVSFGAAFFNIVRYSCESQHKTEYIIVPGCKVNGTSPGRFMNARLNAAYRYLRDNPGSKAILSGGQGDGEDIPEGRCMYNELTKRGIDPGRLITEEKSTSTRENFEESLKILSSEGIEISEITVVSNDFHEYRAIRLAGEFGLKAYSFPARTPWNGYLPFAVREVLAVWYQVYLGRNNLKN